MENFYLSNLKDSALNIAKLFLDESRKDVTFVFKGSDEKVTAHKMILEAASPVFQTMFSGNFVETNEVEIEDIHPYVFKLLISRIYLFDIATLVKQRSNAIGIFADLYYAAEKYDLEDIRELLIQLMIDNCSGGNVNYLLAKAKLFNLPDLEAACKEYFEEYTYAVLASHIYLQINGSCFYEFFDLENMSCETEFDLYIALQAMVDNKQLLDYSQYLSKIRFLTMEISDILSCKLLSSDDKVAIISNIEANKLHDTPQFPMPENLSFENEVRNFSFHEDYEYGRQYFWTTIMLNCVKYENYYEDFFRQMKISVASKEGTKVLITEGRNKADEKGRVSRDEVQKVTKDIFTLA